MPQADFDAFLKALSARYAGLPGALLHRYARAYGTRAERILAGAASAADLGAEVLPGLHTREIDYLRREEWAMTAEDILYRRSKLALHGPADGAARLDGWLQAHPVTAPGAEAVV
jgi:glycerol-3-phosphate dehydrogenase